MSLQATKRNSQNIGGKISYSTTFPQQCINSAAYPVGEVADCFIVLVSHLAIATFFLG
jgi:hypothetical protein